MRSSSWVAVTGLSHEDLSDEHAWQLSQEFRLTSNFSGPFNFSVGGNYLHYETEENYYVFINTLTLASGPVSSVLLRRSPVLGSRVFRTIINVCRRNMVGFRYPDIPQQSRRSDRPLRLYRSKSHRSLNNEGHNYFLSQNPYTLNSYAAFGEAYYNIANDLKLTAGLRWTDDRKHFIDIPSELDC